MKVVLLNAYNFINSLSLIDIAILCVLVALIILIISLMSTLKSCMLVKQEDVKQYIQKEEITVTKEEPVAKDDAFDLSAVTKQLEEAEKKTIALTPYEEEQEEKAIISYDELLKAKSDLTLNYEETTLEDDLVVKKVDMVNMTSINENVDLEEPKPQAVRVISYEKEEEFLNSLKQLQKLLNS